MDAGARDRDTAWIGGPRTSLSDEIVRVLVERGCAVHASRRLVAPVVVPPWGARRLHPVPDGVDSDAQALRAAGVGGGALLAVAVVDLDDGGPTALRAVARAVSRSRPCRVIVLGEQRTLDRLARDVVPEVDRLTVTWVVRDPSRRADHDPVAARSLADRVVVTALGPGASGAGPAVVVREPADPAGRGGRSSVRGWLRARTTG